MSEVNNECSQKGGNNFLPDEASDEDTIKILLSTDNHVGYNEKCKLRGMDSVAAFEEVLSLAQRHDVDMILLGIANSLFTCKLSIKLCSSSPT